MKRILFFLIAFLFCNSTLICEETVDTKTTLNKATTYYNSDDYTNALEYYVNSVQARESNSGTTYYQLAYSWGNANSDGLTP
ncbi:MAG: hypothetical protein IK002_02010 [Treponema sp.]|uniref:hypothetical protein n=1 Tax=Treponema sp. TaxID=166 RepID=UPI00298E2024|nr:hypothetical protein [Treponema sp.]MBR5932739.1 hypothetical protein [Treponema sp.]